MIAQPSVYFVVDAGNTRLKIGCFHSINDFEVFRFTYDETEKVTQLIAEKAPIATLLSSVVSSEQLTILYEILHPTVLLTHTTPLPIDFSNYSTFPTLGVDRIANAVAASFFAPKAACVIDAGTCIKLDLIDTNHRYLGGSISPGVQMRFDALHEFTAQLPKLGPEKNTPPYIGSSTKDSILSGVINGSTHEIKGFIQHFKQQFPQLTIFLTGGDANMFDFALKNNIFVDQNFTLKGLFLILHHNASL